MIYFVLDHLICSNVILTIRLQKYSILLGSMGAKSTTLQNLIGWAIMSSVRFDSWLGGMPGILSPVKTYDVY